MQALKFGAFPFAYNLGFIVVLLFWLGEVDILAGLGHDVDSLLARVGVLALHCHVVNLGSHAERRVAGQGPRSGGPSQDIYRSIRSTLNIQDTLSLVLQLKLRRHGGVLNVAVTAGLVELVGGETGAGSRAVGLYGVTLIEQTFLIELLQEPPQRLDIAVLVGNVGMVEIHPVAHLLTELAPLGGVLHHVSATLVVVVVYAYLLADVLLTDAQSLLHAQLHRQSVSIPTGLARHVETLHRLIAANGVLDSAGQHMVDTRMTIG